MAAGRGGAAPPAGPRWTAHPPGSRGLSWRRRFTHKAAQSVHVKERVRERRGRGGVIEKWKDQKNIKDVR